MAILQRGPYDVDTLLVSPNATAITYSGTNGALTYSSGGIPAARCVKLDVAGGSANYDCILATTGDQIYGVSLDGPARDKGQSLEVQTSGIARIQASAVTASGDLVYVGDSSGRVTTAPAAGATQSYLVGRALTAATVVGDYISVRLMIGSATNVNA